jgi:hypothetical protein
MLIDCIKREFKKSDEKIVWVLVIILTQIIGAFIYYLIVKQKEDKLRTDKKIKNKKKS